MITAVIVDVIRSPMGRGKAGVGQLSEMHPVDLVAQMLGHLFDRNDIDAAGVDDFLLGCVSQAGEQGNMPGRMAWLAAGLPPHVPATMIDRKCGSSQQAVHFAAQGVMSGVYDIVIAGGIEVMSRVPMGSARQGADTEGELLKKVYAEGLVPQSVSSELVAARWNVRREEMDAYAAQSHHRALAAQKSGLFDNEIVPIVTPAGTATKDETIRSNVSEEAMAELRTPFDDPVMNTRFPEIKWSNTAGNSSQISDGAGLCLIMSEKRAIDLGLTPRARFVGFDVVGADPIEMLAAPIPATRRILKKTNLAVSEIDHFEVNEAFASIPLAWQKDFDADPLRLNPKGGAISLGHPLGASGIRLLASMMNGLEATGGKLGLQTMCENGGMANAMIIERL